MNFHILVPNPPPKQAEKLKSLEMKERWMKNDEGGMKKDEVWVMKDDDFKPWGVLMMDRQTDRLTNGHLWL